ncbi:type II secretory pathway predicted ATPase ExeA [Sulfitobacter undariae]|uniref:Type II secretory pathway predicted ATPase ExeA n=1 Tax=Sulfitobacter undariae TaxID=1563671 RepID=A0A7W6E760_9RHOB|nr:TniB family NTP-binding protein [Sulfitobacter undariae]MBB3996006.1 type II secretory pathway predicted ATPase ExeA [Sulfitobacter undariae]
MTDTTSITPVTIPEKLKWLDDRYWRFGQDEMMSDFVEDLFDVDEQGQMTGEPRRDPLTGETKGLMVLGGSGSGKTAMLQRMLRKSPVLTKFKDDLTGNTLVVTVPPDATIKKLGEIILAKTGYNKVDPRSRAADLWEMARHRFSIVGIKTVIIDESHHMLLPGPGKDTRTAIQSLKHLMQSENSAALVIAGVPALRDAIMSEPSGETFRRCRVYELSKIRTGSNAARLFAMNFTMSAEKLGVKVHAEDAFVERILFAEHGQVGRSIALGKEILRDAVIRNREELAPEHAERVFRKIKGDIEMTPFHPSGWEAVKRELESIGWSQ